MGLAGAAQDRAEQGETLEPLGALSREGVDATLVSAYPLPPRRHCLQDILVRKVPSPPVTWPCVPMGYDTSNPRPKQESKFLPILSSALHLLC